MKLTTPKNINYAATIVKAKSPIFLQHETKLLDKNVSDIETEEVLV